MNIDENGILNLGAYHPRRGGSNPHFDEFSDSILTLKEGPEKAGFQTAFDSFKALVRHEFDSRDWPFWKNCAVAVVPSHDPERLNSGIRLLVSDLCRQDRVDATGSLIRTKKIRKQATGGSRDIKHHLNSMEVNAKVLPSDRVVLVFDDVTTTGNSLLACRKLLTRAGDIKCMIL